MASAAIGFGGLAAWTVTTQNNGSSFSAGTVHHTNKATSNITVTNATGPASVIATCSDVTSPGSCGLVINVFNARPGASATGSIQITNTGTLASAFTFNLVGAPVGALCNDLTLQVVDNEAAPQAVAIGGSIRTSGGSLTFNPADTGTYTFTVTLSAAAPVSDMGASCTAPFIFTQTNT